MPRGLRGFSLPPIAFVRVHGYLCGMNDKIRNECFLVYRIEYTDAIPITHFTDALSALSSEYQKFLYDTYESERPEAKLYVQAIEKGSIVTTLVEYAMPILPFIGEVNTVIEFGTFLKKSYDYLRSKGSIDKNLDNKDLDNLERIITPAIQTNNNISLSLEGCHIENLIFANESEARAIRDRIQEEKNSTDNGGVVLHEKVGLVLEQIKRGDKGKGNKGVIEQICKETLNLVWQNDHEKNEIVSMGENPMSKIFIVDVEHVTNSYNKSWYKIIKVHETFPLDD